MFLFFIILLLPATAYAYLDPGTGNALVAAFFGLLGAAVYFLKNFYYVMKSRITGNKEAGEEIPKLAIFSEGKSYWPYFKDIFEELASRGIVFSFYTLDLYDPALDTEYDNAKVYYAGRGNRGYARITNLKEPVVLSSTPNIGTPGYPVKKSRYTQNLIHMFHGIYDTGTYIKGSLDSCDTVFLNGEEQERSIRELEKMNRLNKKDLIITGSPFIDDLISRSKQNPQLTDGKTVLVASTWDKKGCLTAYGPHFIKLIAQAGYNVIVRPHPQSYKLEKHMIDALEKELANYQNITFDNSPNGLPSLSKADIMISDISGVRFDYIMCYSRPVITLKTPAEDFSNYECDTLGYVWEYDISNKIGLILDGSEINNIVYYIKTELEKYREKELDTAKICLTGDAKNKMATAIEKIIRDLPKK